MTKPDPVCGALTHRRTPCQNTLVTGCGLCPVHASQLRAANAPFKQRSKPRRKKPLSQTQKSSSTTFITPSIQTPQPNQRHSPLPNSDHLLSDHFLYNISPIQQQSQFYQEQEQEHSVMHELKNHTEVLDIFKSHSLTMDSPVTPKAPDSSLKPDLFDEDHHIREDSDISPRSPSPQNHLQTSTDAYLLEVDLPIDLPVPKFD